MLTFFTKRDDKTKQSDTNLVGSTIVRDHSYRIPAVLSSVRLHYLMRSPYQAWLWWSVDFEWIRSFKAVFLVTESTKKAVRGNSL